MALTEIEYGALASSEVMNNNFNYLDNRISNLSETVISNNAGINSNIATINSTVAILGENLNTEIAELNTNLGNTTNLFSENGCYITSYFNEGSWYKEYFSDADKTQRVWLEQGGKGTGEYTIQFLKPFQNTDYGIYAQRTSWGYEHSTIITNKTVSSCFLSCRGSANAMYNGSADWYACGK